MFKRARESQRENVKEHVFLCYSYIERIMRIELGIFNEFFFIFVCLLFFKNNSLSNILYFVVVCVDVIVVAVIFLIVFN